MHKRGKKTTTKLKGKITAAMNETFGAWRESQHDDLILAMALAARGEWEPMGTGFAPNVIPIGGGTQPRW